jgi:CO/xanthine dehydrogenase Mo-binding subunit
VISETIKSSRFTGTPIEPRVVVARYDRTTHLMEVWDTTQSAHVVVGWIQRAIALPGLRIHVVVSRLGGAFGQKGTHYSEEILIPMAAYLTNKPVRWVETRSEHMVATIHGREQVHHMDVAVANDGTILGLKDRIIVNMGTGWSSSGPPSVIISTMFVPGVYRIRNYEAQLLGVVTNKTAFGAHRGFGKAEAAYVIERLIEIIARKLGLDPIELRRRNFIRANDFPYRSVTGSQYDSGNYEAILNKALKLADYYGWRKKQEQARQEGRFIGIGTAVVIEPTSTHRRGAAMSYGVRIRMDPSGEVWVFLSGNDDGTGHGTVISQIVADELGVRFNNVNVVEGDTMLCPPGTGSHSSRFAIMGASAAMLGARELRKKIIAVASAMLESSPEELVIEDGTVRVENDPSRQLPIHEVARLSYFAGHRLPEGVEPGMEILYYYRDPNVNPKFDERGRLAAYSSFPYAADIAVVEVSPETGKVQILQYVSVHDCGNMINPKEVAGQHLGALAHGIGGALYEELVYDESGQPLAQNFKDYMVPTAVEVPNFKLDHMTTPAPFTPGGFKGAGETGTVSPPPCLANAVEDALSPLGIEIRTLPLKPDYLWELLRSARRAS